MFSSLSLLFPTRPLTLFRTTVCLSVDCCLCSGARGGTEITGLKFRRWEMIARTHDAAMHLRSRRGAELRQLLLCRGQAWGEDSPWTAVVTEEDQGDSWLSPIFHMRKLSPRGVTLTCPTSAFQPESSPPKPCIL